MDEPFRDDRIGAGLVLVGYRGTGKTTVGRILAERTNRPFVDADEVCRELAGRTIAEIFETDGEQAFRDLEARAIEQATARNPGAILATSGGAVLRPENVERIRRHGVVVWLTASPETLAHRLSLDPQARPALTAAGTLAEIAQVLASREPLYRLASHRRMETGGLEPSRVADLVLPLIGKDSSS